MENSPPSAAPSLPVRNQTLTALVDRMITALHGAFPSCRAAFSVIEPNRTMRVLRVLEPEGMPTLAGFSDHCDKAPTYFAALCRGETLAIDDVQDHPLIDPVLAEAFAAFQVSAVMDVPVVIAEKFVALLCVDSPTPRAWSATDIARVEMLGSVLAGAMSSSERGPEETTSLAARALSHEVNNSMLVVQWALTQACEAAESGTPPPNGQTLRAALQASQWVPELVRSFATQRTAGDRQSVALADLVQQAVGCVQAEAAEREITVQRPTAASHQVRVEPGAIVQILLNLLLNALRAAPLGGTVEIEAEASAFEVTLKVRDNGAGIDPALAPRIFEPGIRGSQSSGSGLGLYICRQLADSQSSRIELEHSDRDGTCFALTLPLATGARGFHAPAADSGQS